MFFTTTNIIIVIIVIIKILSVRMFVQVCAGLCGFVRLVRFVRVLVRGVCALSLCKTGCAFPMGIPDVDLRPE